MNVSPLLFRALATWLAAAALLSLSACNTASRERDYVPAVARFYLEATEIEAGELAVLPESGGRINVLAKPVFVETDIANVELVQVELGRCLLFQFTPAAARDLYRLTGNSQGRRLVLSLNGVAYGARLIERPFADGSILTFVEMPDEALIPLVESLKRTSVDLQKEVARKS